MATTQKTRAARRNWTEDELNTIVGSLDSASRGDGADVAEDLAKQFGVAPGTIRQLYYKHRAGGSTKVDDNSPLARVKAMMRERKKAEAKIANAQNRLAKLPETEQTLKEMILEAQAEMEQIDSKLGVFGE